MNRSRRAVSLIELVVVMSASTVVLTLSSALVCRVMRAQVDSRAYADSERNALRMSELFRSDVHQAKAAVTNRAELAGNGLLRLQLASGQQVAYSLRGGVVLRTVSANGKSVARDEFAFSDSCQVSIQRDGSPPSLTLLLTTKPKDVLEAGEKQVIEMPNHRISVRIESVLGRDLRFAAIPGASQ